VEEGKCTMKTYSWDLWRDREGDRAYMEAHRKETWHVFYPSNADASSLLPTQGQGNILFSE